MKPSISTMSSNGILKMGLMLLTLGFACITMSIQPAYSIPIVIPDDGGADDQPGQKDLTQMTIDYAANGSGQDFDVSWGWDDINVSGNNTGDACSLYDTDDDGNANFSLCVIWENGATYVSTILYSCGDARSDRCDQPVVPLAEDQDGDGDLESLVGGPYQSTCSPVGAVPDSDPFTHNGNVCKDRPACLTTDTVANCAVYLDDFGGADTAFLINVCSYPSGEPNSDPSDCVVNPDSGFLTIVKTDNNYDPNDPAQFTFNLGAGQESNDGRTSFTIDGSGSVDLISFVSGLYDLTEVVPNAYVLDSADCVLSNGFDTGDFVDPTISDIEIQVGRETTCTFVNSLALPNPEAVILEKVVVNDNGGDREATEWTLSAALTATDDPNYPSDAECAIPAFSGAPGPGSTENSIAYTGELSASNDFFNCYYRLSESGPSDYTASSWSCKDQSNNIVTLQGTNGDILELNSTDAATLTRCTITNDDDAPSLTLVKQVTNDNGGTAVPGDWTLTAAGYDTASPDAGTYNLSETGPANYTQTSLTCDNATGQVTSVTLGLGEDVTCTFVNDDDAPSLTLVKSVTNDNCGAATADQWTLTASGYNAADPQTGTYALSESGGPAGYTQTSLTCDNATGQVTSVTLGLGEDVTCTFVNDDIPPILQVVKTPDGVIINQGEKAEFTITVTNVGDGPACDVVLNDTLPSPNGALSPLTWVENPDDALCDITSGTGLQCDIGDLSIAGEPGDSFTVTVEADVPLDYIPPPDPPTGPGLGSGFEIEGNLINNGIGQDWIDGTEVVPPLEPVWTNFINQSDLPTGQGDNSFGKGSKEDTEPPSVVDGSIPNNKSDLTNFLFSEDVVDGNVFLYLGWIRANTLGTANIDFELNQSKVPSINEVTPVRTEGDILITFDFASGGNIVNLGLRLWTGSEWGPETDLDLAGDAEGAVNDGFTTPNPLGEPDPLADKTFGEAVVNLTSAFSGVSANCQSFASAYVKSRSSASFTAALKDFIAPIPVDIDTCQTIDLPNTATATGTLTVDPPETQEVSDSGLIKVTNRPPPTP